MIERKKVLLTGVTGFLGSHTTIQLLDRGYDVLGTLRDVSRAESIKVVIGRHTQNVNNLTLAEADLLDEDKWYELAKEVDYVVHIASPFPRILPKNEIDLILPAKKGTLNVLQAASHNGVKRVVVTSSTGAIVYGKDKARRSGIFTEEDWTEVNNKADTTPYFRSKTLAERAAWEFIENDENDMELAVICPGAILGPILEKDYGTSANIVLKTMDGSSPALPQIGFDIVDVRSVSDLLIKAMEREEAAGERFIGTAGFMSFSDVAETLRREYPEMKIPKKRAPNFLIRILANFDPTIKPILNDLGVERRLDNSKAKQLLGWKPLDTTEAVLACARSAFELGLL